MDHDYDDYDGYDRCRGFFDGFAAGPNWVDLAGNRHNVSPDEPDDSEYVAGAAEGRAARIERDQQQATT